MLGLTPPLAVNLDMPQVLVINLAVRAKLWMDTSQKPKTHPYYYYLIDIFFNFFNLTISFNFMKCSSCYNCIIPPSLNAHRSRFPRNDFD